MLKQIDYSTIRMLLKRLQEGPLTCDEILQHFGWNPNQMQAIAKILAEEQLILTQGDSGWRLTDAAGMGEYTLHWRCHVPVFYIPMCESTNVLAAKVSENDPNIQLIVTDYQTAGKGRLGRTWNSEIGENLLFSLVVKPDLPPEKIARASLVWGAVIADELNLQVKWPNDIVDRQGRKVGGILSEIQLEGARLKRVIFGFGLNVNQVSFDGLPNAVSLRMLGNGKPLDRALICSKLVRRILDADVQQSLDLWRERSSMLGKRVRIGEVEGIAEAIREDGALIVDGQVILTGDVFLVQERI